MVAAPGLTFEAALKRDRWIILGALAAITALCWFYLVDMALGMTPPADTSASMGADMGAMMGEAMRGMPMSGAWNGAQFAAMLAMWIVMMIGMMLPSATPMTLIFARISRTRRARGQSAVPTAIFLAGYLLAWVGFSLVAVFLQWGLQSAALVSPMMVSTSPYLGGVLFIAAGVYQLTPLKQACLRNCRSPLDFVLHRWRTGRAGTLRMGFEHGLYCTGCCWVLMLLLFVLGVMNLAWVAGLTALVLVEKIAPGGEWVARASGAAAIVGGIYLIVAA